MPHLEREIKLRLASADDYETVCRTLPGFHDEKEQQNSYWDLPDGALRAAGVMLRLRLEGNTARVTVKRDHQQKEGVFEAPEDEEAIAREDADGLLSGERSWESLSCGVTERLTREFGSLRVLRRWGAMTNHRRRYRLPEGFVAEVDRTVFLGRIVEHEVEVEAADSERAREVIQAYLTAAGVNYETQSRTKSERLRGHLENAEGRSDDA